MGFLRFMASSKLPEDWPSSLHHKCTERKCTYANPPKVAAGRYVCLGSIDGSPCKGTYEVSLKEVKASIAWCNGEQERLNEKNKLMAQVQAARQRKDHASLYAYKDQLDTYLKLLKADEDGDETVIDEYVAEVGLPNLRRSARVWQEHLHDVKIAVLKLEKAIEELHNLH